MKYIILLITILFVGCKTALPIPDYPEDQVMYAIFTWHDGSRLQSDTGRLVYGLVDFKDWDVGEIDTKYNPDIPYDKVLAVTFIGKQ